MAGCGVVRGWVCGGRDFFIFSFILVAQAWCLRFILLFCDYLI